MKIGAIALVIGSVIFEPSPTDDAAKSPDYYGNSSRDFYIPMSNNKTQQLTIAVFTMALCLAIPTVVKAADRPDPNLSTEPSQTDVKYPYPAEIVSAMTEECATSASKLPKALATKLCGCMMTGFQNRYSINEFKEIGLGLTQGKPMPKSMEEVITTCTQEALQAK
jgi:hypothetical protein